MRIRLAIPDKHVTAPVLDAVLEATTRAAAAQMAAGEAPTFSDLLRQGVKWKPESFADGEHFDLPGIVGERGWGDCDDLGPCLAGELRATGQDPGARSRVIRTGPERWHAIVELSDGRILDPSRMAGMRSPQGVRGGVVRPMASVGESAVAIAKHNGQWWARTDVPWGNRHLTSLSRDFDAARALDRSVVGALACGGVLEWPYFTDRTTLGQLFEDVATGALPPQRWQQYPSGPFVARF